MPHAEFLAAAVPTPHVCLGLKLRPFCLGHRLLLERIGSPFVASVEASATVPDLLIAVALCSQTFEDGEQFLADSNSTCQISKWERKISRRYWFFPRKVDFGIAVSIFRDYLEAGLQQPKIWIHEGRRIETGAPWQQRLKLGLMAIGFSESEALNKYLPLAWHDYLTDREFEMKTKLFYTDEDAELKRMADAMEASAAAPAQEAQAC